MNKIPFFILDSFADAPFQGNPAGVFFDDDAILSDEEMRRFCREVSLESAFVLPPGDSDADFRMRYFTATAEVALCGHATVGAATALVHAGCVKLGASLRIATAVGILMVGVSGGAEITLHQNVPEFGPVCDEAMVVDVANALGCSSRDILDTGLPVQRVSTGSPFLFVPVSKPATVDAAPADYAAIARLSEQTGTYGIYVFASDSDHAFESGFGYEVWSRCFAPLVGLNEDPVTGSASGALGAYLARQGVLEIRPPSTDFIIARQGYVGGRGGSIMIVVSKNATGEIWRISVRGKAILMAEGAFTVHPSD